MSIIFLPYLLANRLLLQYGKNVICIVLFVQIPSHMNPRQDVSSFFRPPLWVVSPDQVMTVHRYIVCNIPTHTLALATHQTATVSAKGLCHETANNNSRKFNYKHTRLSLKWTKWEYSYAQKFCCRFSHDRYSALNIHNVHVHIWHIHIPK